MFANSSPRPFRSSVSDACVPEGLLILVVRNPIICAAIDSHKLVSRARTRRLHAVDERCTSWERFGTEDFEEDSAHLEATRISSALGNRSVHSHFILGRIVCGLIVLSSENGMQP